MIYDFKTYLNEKSNNELDIGVLVECLNGNMDGIEVGGLIGIIILKDACGGGELNGQQKSGNMYKIQFSNLDQATHKQTRFSIGSTYWVFEELLIPVTGERYEKHLKKKEEMRLKHIDIDPYGEENWD